MNEILAVAVNELVTDAILDRAYSWICSQRKDAHHNNSVWDLRFNWIQLKSELQHKLLTGNYRFSPLRRFKINDEFISSWDAMDALVLKALSITLQPLFSISEFPHCTHLKGAGGIHAAIRQVHQKASQYHHVLKSDAYHYYESIDHSILMALMKKKLNCPVLLHLIEQYCQRLETREGHYYHFRQGIPMGCPLSPLVAALYLQPLDDAFAKSGFYVRFMDDWIVMVKTKHQLRKIIKQTYIILDRLKLKMHPDKTFFGCIKKGFDFLGVHFCGAPEIAKTCIENHRTKLAQRYAQGASTACIGHYIDRWTSWCKGVLRCCSIDTLLLIPMEATREAPADHMGQPKETTNEQSFYRRSITTKR